jgi:hypothetical protein
MIIADFGISRIISKEMQVKAFVVSTIKGASIMFAAPETVQRCRGQHVPN